jgi:hypothetical protein
MIRILGTILLLVFIVFGAVSSACGGGMAPTPTPTATPAVSPTPVLTPTPAPSVSSIPILIGYVTYDGQRYACYNESAVLSDLLKSSTPFRSFYNAKRASMPAQILWAQDQYHVLPFNVPAMTDPANNITILKNMPPTVDDSFIIAHELCTYLQQAEGFRDPEATDLAKRTGNESIANSIASSLSTMVSTSVRDNMLKPYFDLTKAYHIYLDGFLTEPAWPHATLPDKVSWMTFYVQMMLYWNDVLGYKFTGQFEKSYDQKYADILDDSNKMLNVVKTNGYDKPEEWATLFPKIIKEFDLGDWIIYEGNTTTPQAT